MYRPAGSLRAAVIVRAEEMQAEGPKAPMKRLSSDFPRSGRHESPRRLGCFCTCRARAAVSGSRTGATTPGSGCGCWRYGCPSMGAGVRDVRRFGRRAVRVAGSAARLLGPGIGLTVRSPVRSQYAAELAAASGSQQNQRPDQRVHRTTNAANSFKRPACGSGITGRR
jgi:hypothetical protein